MSDRPEPGRRLRRDDEQALEEIRRLFARYRRLARHDDVRERDEEDEKKDRRPADRLTANRS